MVLYNDSFMDNATNPLDLIIGIGNATGQSYLFGNLLLISFFLIFMILGYQQDWMSVLLIDAFVTTIIAILLAFTGMISFATISVPAILFFMVLVFYLFG